MKLYNKQKIVFEISQSFGWRWNTCRVYIWVSINRVKLKMKIKTERNQNNYNIVKMDDFQWNAWAEYLWLLKRSAEVLNAYRNQRGKYLTKSKVNFIFSGLMSTINSRPLSSFIWINTAMQSIIIIPSLVEY